MALLSSNDISITGSPAVEATKLSQELADKAFEAGFNTAQKVLDVPVRAKQRVNEVGKIDAEVALRPGETALKKAENEASLDVLPKTAELKKAATEQAIIMARQNPLVAAMEKQLQAKGVSVTGLYDEDGGVPPLQEIQRRFDAEMDRAHDRETAEDNLDIAKKSLQGIRSNSTLTDAQRASMAERAEKEIVTAQQQVNALRGNVRYGQKRAADTTETPAPFITELPAETPGTPESINAALNKAEVPSGPVDVAPKAVAVTPAAVPVTPKATASTQVAAPVTPAFSVPFPNPETDSQVYANAAAVESNAADVKAKQEKAKADALAAVEQAKAAAAEAKVVSMRESDIKKQGLIVTDIDRALGKLGTLTTGVAGQVLKNVGGTSAYDLDQLLEGVRANIGFAKLQEMRQNSPTGGALGQVSDRENKLLQAVEGSLSLGQSPAQLRENLLRVKNNSAEVLGIISRVEDAYRAEQGLPALPKAAPAAPAAAAAPAGAYKVGARKLQNGTVFVYDGSKWNSQP